MAVRNGYYSEQNRNESYKAVKSNPAKLTETHNKIISALEKGGLANFQIAEITGLTIIRELLDKKKNESNTNKAAC